MLCLCAYKSILVNSLMWVYLLFTLSNTSTYTLYSTQPWWSPVILVPHPICYNLRPLQTNTLHPTCSSFVFSHTMLGNESGKMQKNVRLMLIIYVLFRRHSCATLGHIYYLVAAIVNPSASNGWHRPCHMRRW